MLLSKRLGIGYESVLAEVAEDIQLGEGVHYLLASNGRGKTTLLRTLAGLIRKKAGNFTLNGRCQFISEDLRFDPQLTPRHVFKALIPGDRMDASFALAQALELDLKKAFGKLSFGNRNKVGLIVSEFRCQQGAAEILLYDEPFTGLDTRSREIICKHWEKNAENVLRLVACHPDFDAMALPSAVLISDGNITLETDSSGNWADLKKRLD